MENDLKTQVIKLGNLGTLTTVIQTLTDEENGLKETNIFQTLALENSNENSTIELNNSNPKVPLIGGPEDLSELERLVHFLTVIQ